MTDLPGFSRAEAAWLEEPDDYTDFDDYDDPDDDYTDPPGCLNMHILAGFLAGAAVTVATLTAIGTLFGAGWSIVVMLALFAALAWVVAE